MSDKSYMTEDKNISVSVHFYPVDGVQISVDLWDEEEEDYYTVVDSRYICDSFYEAMCSALFEGCDITWEQAESQCADWGIFAPENEEED